MTKKPKNQSSFHQTFNLILRNDQKLSFLKCWRSGKHPNTECFEQNHCLHSDWCPWCIEPPPFARRTALHLRTFTRLIYSTDTDCKSTQQFSSGFWSSWMEEVCLFIFHILIISVLVLYHIVWFVLLLNVDQLPLWSSLDIKMFFMTIKIESIWLH